uniref:Uncharacterized protein n=1 Tax=Nelumbo nucifera TaxID=4432 RepID=A0A822ZL36_NELNU|nr:TPA_asm: hypothetical protein HUJ06_002385 [Nelumbo nucifera]
MSNLNVTLCQVPKLRQGAPLNVLGRWLQQIPFGHFLDLPHVPVEMFLLNDLLKSWDLNTHRLTVGQRMVKFSEAGVAWIMGLGLSDSTIALSEGLPNRLFMTLFGLDENHYASIELDVVFRRLKKIVLLDG